MSSRATLIPINCWNDYQEGQEDLVSDEHKMWEHTVKKLFVVVLSRNDSSQKEIVVLVPSTTSRKHDKWY